MSGAGPSRERLRALTMELMLIPGLSGHDGDRTLLAPNRGHGHVNRKLARDSTVEFAIALDGRGDVHCEPTGPNEAILLRKLDLPAGESVSVDLLISGAFTGWRGDPGTFEHWLRPRGKNMPRQRPSGASTISETTTRTNRFWSSSDVARSSSPNS